MQIESFHGFSTACIFSTKSNRKEPIKENSYFFNLRNLLLIYVYKSRTQPVYLTAMSLIVIVLNFLPFQLYFPGLYKMLQVKTG